MVGNLDSEHIGLNLKIHDIDFTIWLMGEADKVIASGIDVKNDQSIVTAGLKYKDSYATVRGASAKPSSYPFSVG